MTLFQITSGGYMRGRNLINPTPEATVYDLNVYS